MTDFSTKKISKKLITEILEAVKDIDSYGSVEIYVQDNTVTQITTRNIRKTKNSENKEKENGNSVRNVS